MWHNIIRKGAAAAIIAMAAVACSKSPKPEVASHYIDVAENLPTQVKRIDGMTYSEVVARFGSPDYAYYYPAVNAPDADTVIVPTVVGLWDLGTSPYKEAQDILDALADEDDEMSGFCSAELIVNFRTNQNGLTAIQATLE